MKFHVEAGEGYTVFVPPNLDSDDWELEGAHSLTQGFNAVIQQAKG